MGLPPVWERSLQTFDELLSLSCALYTIHLCLWKFDRRKLMVRQLAALSCSQVARCLWCFILPCVEYGSLLWPGAPRWCGPWKFVARILQLQAVLFSACIGCGVLAALLHSSAAISAQHYALLAVPPLSVVMSLAYILVPSTPRTPEIDGVPVTYCESTFPSNAIFATEVCLVFLGMVPVYGKAILRLRRAAPAGVVAKSVSAAVRYLSAFFLAYGLYVFSQLVNLRRHSDAWWIVHVLKDQLYILYAFFNFLALTAERREAATARFHHSVAFRSTVSSFNGSPGSSASSPRDRALLPTANSSPVVHGMPQTSEDRNAEFWLRLNVCSLEGEGLSQSPPRAPELSLQPASPYLAAEA